MHGTPLCKLLHLIPFRSFSRKLQETSPPLHTWPRTVHGYQIDHGRVLSKVFGITHYSFGRHGIEEI